LLGWILQPLKKEEELAMMKKNFASFLFLSLLFFLSAGVVSEYSGEREREEEEEGIFRHGGRRIRELLIFIGKGLMGWMRILRSLLTFTYHITPCHIHISCL
jgi:hypothetical protein